MRTLPLFHGEPATSLWAVMLFPDDMAKARAFAASALAPALDSFISAGRKWAVDDQRYYLQSIMLGLPGASEIQDRLQRGTEVGEAVKVLWGLICGSPASASWRTTFKIVTQAARQAGVRTGRTALHDHLGQFRRVLPYWGAWAIRGRKASIGAERGYTGVDEVDALLMEAMSVQAGLMEWSVGRGRSDGVFVSDDVFRPWVGWSPPNQDRFPGIGAVPMFSLPADIVPHRKTAGKPRKPRPK